MTDPLACDDGSVTPHDHLTYLAQSRQSTKAGAHNRYVTVPTFFRCRAGASRPKQWVVLPNICTDRRLALDMLDDCAYDVRMLYVNVLEALASHSFLFCTIFIRSIFS